MTGRGAEALTSALRRSLRLIVALIVVGVIAVNVFSQLQGPSYQAESRVEIPATPLSQVISGTQPTYVDPQRSQDTAAALAASPTVYEVARNQTSGRLGSAGGLQAVTTVAEVPDTDILSFTSTASSAVNAQKIANAVAHAYVLFNQRNTTTTIDATATKLRRTLASLSPGSQRRQVQTELDRLQLLLGANSGNASIVQRAVSADKTRPAPGKDTALGFVLGLVVGLILVAIREAVDTRVRSDADVEEVLNTRVLARVRPLPRRAKLVSYGRNQAVFADVYSMLASQLVPLALDTPRIIAFTSSIAQEGKTSTCANLAVSLARRGTKVILADFDFRKPDLARLFQVPEDATGAIQVVNGLVNLDAAMWNVSLEGARPQPYRATELAPTGGGIRLKPGDSPSDGSLQLLPAGGFVSPAQGGASDALPLRPLLEALRARAEVVIVDTAPALLTADVNDFADEIDSVVFVVRQGYASTRNLQLLASRAQSWPTEVAGAVLTDAPLPTELSGYYAR